MNTEQQQNKIIRFGHNVLSGQHISMSCQSRYFIFILSFPGPTIDDVNLAIFKVFFLKKNSPALLVGFIVR